MRPNNKDKFFARTKETPEGCWIWQGGRSGKYGKTTYLYETWLAHRLAWFFTHSEVPSALVCHKCDTPLCVNPAHLFLGTHSDNTKDAVSKGRHICNYPPMPGEKHPMHKLTWPQVREIRNSELSGRKAAAYYGVDRRTIAFIRQGKTWKE